MSAKQSYSEKLRSPQWQRKRLEIMQRDNFCCRDCQSTTSNLQVHHTYYTAKTEPWEYDDDSLVTLCDKCHDEITKRLPRFLMTSQTPEMVMLHTQLLELTNAQPGSLASVCEVAYGLHLIEQDAGDYHVLAYIVETLQKKLESAKLAASMKNEQTYKREIYMKNQGANEIDANDPFAYLDAMIAQSDNAQL